MILMSYSDGTLQPCVHVAQVLTRADPALSAALLLDPVGTSPLAPSLPVYVPHCFFLVQCLGFVMIVLHLGN